MKTITLTVTGMGCMKCVAKVENALSSVVGVMDTTVTLEATSEVVQCLDSTSKDALIEAITEVGFKAE